MRATFRERLLTTIHAARPVLEVPGVLIVGSEVPNLLEPGAAATLVVSQDLDVGVPVEQHAAVKQQLTHLREFHPSPDEPSVWVPREPGLLEVNLHGIDAGRQYRLRHPQTDGLGPPGCSMRHTVRRTRDPLDRVEARR